MSTASRAKKEKADNAIAAAAPATVPPNVQVYDDGTNTFFWYVMAKKSSALSVPGL